MVHRVADPFIEELAELLRHASAGLWPLPSPNRFFQVLHVGLDRQTADVADVLPVRINPKGAVFHEAPFEDGMVFGQQLGHSLALSHCARPSLLRKA